MLTGKRRATADVEKSADKPRPAEAFSEQRPNPLWSRLATSLGTGVTLQPKLTVSPPDDPYEREADRVAEQVMRMPDPGGGAEEEEEVLTSPEAPAVQRMCAECEEEKLQRTCAECEQEDEDGPVQTKPGPGAAVPRVSPSTAAGIRSLRRKGERLSSSSLAFFQPRFGADLSGVRVHADAGAAGRAREVRARAFTLGHDIVFAAGEYRPESASGRLLLAHELTHVVQQSGADAEGRLDRQAEGAGGIGTRIRRAPADQPSSCANVDVPDVVFAAAPRKYWEDEGWSEEERILPFVECPTLVDKISKDQIVHHGAHLVSVALEFGHTAIARRLLARMTGNQIPNAWKKDVSSTPGSVNVTDAEALLEQAADAAYRAQHGLAMELLAVIYGLTQIVLFQASEALRNYPTRPDEFEGWQGILTNMFSIYPELIRAYRREGRRALAEHYEGEWEKIQRNLFDHHTIKETPPMRPFPGQPPPGPGPNDIRPVVVGTAEVADWGTEVLGGKKQDVRTRYDLTGTEPGSSTESVKPLTQQQRSLSYPTITDSMENVARDIAGQQNFLTELDHWGAISKAFPGRPPDLRSRDERIHAWAAAYKSNPYDHGQSFAWMMSLIAGYLEVFTLHSTWDVDDSGKTYLSREMPRDLAGRLLQDCGVYALSVATEVFAAVKRAGHGKLSAEIFLLPTHVVLVLFHESAGNYYVISNDQITGPLKGSPGNIKPVLGQVGGAFGGVIGREDPASDIVAPVGRVQMGSTDEYSEEEFNERYWQRYSTASEGYNALEQAYYGKDREAFDTRNTIEQYDAQISKYRRNLAFLAVKLHELVGKDLVDNEALIREPLEAAKEALEIFDVYGPGSARPNEEGSIIAPRGGRSRAQQRAARVLAKPPDRPGPNTPDPHLYHTEFKVDPKCDSEHEECELKHPLIQYLEVLQKFFAAKGVTLDCNAAHDDLSLEKIACDLDKVF